MSNSPKSSPTRPLNLNLSRVNEQTAAESESKNRELMFEKPLTPSDVGKLNRLVIPKQYALNYFPFIDPNVSKKDSSTTSSLSFEDELGKFWRFRYSYWNSSQSYVLTKGWSRFVREKQLDAGDAVFFQRHRTEVDCFFIGWRRRRTTTRMQQDTGTSTGGRSYSAQPDCLHHAGTSEQNQAGGSKRLRLFGVNVKCHQPDESELSPTPDPTASLWCQDPAP